jgi:hypothetical protein
MSGGLEETEGEATIPSSCLCWEVFVRSQWSNLFACGGLPLGLVLSLSWTFLPLKIRCCLVDYSHHYYKYTFKQQRVGKVAALLEPR